MPAPPPTGRAAALGRLFGPDAKADDAAHEAAFMGRLHGSGLRGAQHAATAAAGAAALVLLVAMASHCRLAAHTQGSAGGCYSACSRLTRRAGPPPLPHPGRRAAAMNPTAATLVCLHHRCPTGLRHDRAPLPPSRAAHAALKADLMPDPNSSEADPLLNNPLSPAEDSPWALHSKAGERHCLSLHFRCHSAEDRCLCLRCLQPPSPRWSSSTSTGCTRETHSSKPRRSGAPMHCPQPGWRGPFQ